MNKRGNIFGFDLKNYLIILVHLVLGLGNLILFEKLQLPFWLNSSVATLLVFVLMNLTSAHFLKLNTELKEFWSLKKIHYIFFGSIGGLLISFLPTLIRLSIGKSNLSDVHFNSDITLMSILITLVICSWEELWFRGLFLNYCNRKISSINLSLIIGILFMLIHMLNPKINLLVQGPGLFFAGAFLTMVYFYFKSIWLPIGLHFGNNFFGSRLELGNSNDILFGEDGYIGAIILAILFVVLVYKTRKRTELKQSE